MAGSRTFINSSNGQYGSHYPQTLIVNWDDYDIVNNRTYVNITYQRSTDNQSQYHNYGYANPSQISIDGSQVASATPYSAHNTQITQTLCTWGGWINHNNDGTKTINVSASFYATNQNSNLPSGSVSGTVQLPTIPRASDIGVLDANIGSSTTITINKKNNSFTTKLYWKVQGDNNWIYIDETSQISYSWTVPTSLYQRIPNNRTIVCEFKATTLSGTTTIGEKTTTATFTATGDPIINSVNVVDTSAGTIYVTHNSNVLVKYKSTAKISVDTEAQNSASISSVKVNNINATYNSTSQKWELSIQKVETNQFDIVVTDSRGYPANDTETVTMVDYVPLTISATLTRNQPTDGKINMSINGNYFNDTFGAEHNTLTLKYRYKEYGQSYQDNWVTLTPTITGNTYTLTTQLSNFDYTKQYEFQIDVFDQLDYQRITGIVITKGQPIFNWGEDFFNINGTLKINGNPVNL